jgi:hypothetical protein
MLYFVLVFFDNCTWFLILFVMFCIHATAVKTIFSKSWQCNRAVSMVVFFSCRHTCFKIDHLFSAAHLIRLGQILILRIFWPTPWSNSYVKLLGNHNLHIVIILMLHIREQLYKQNWKLFWKINSWTLEMRVHLTKYSFSARETWL